MYKRQLCAYDNPVNSLEINLADIIEERFKRDMVVSVSYTHLDVYKRQGVKNEDGTPGVWTDDKSFRSVKDIYQTTEGEPLDVYKRQGI